MCSLLVTFSLSAQAENGQKRTDLKRLRSVFKTWRHLGNGLNSDSGGQRRRSNGANPLKQLQRSQDTRRPRARLESGYLVT